MTVRPHRIAVYCAMFAVFALVALGPFMSFKPAPFTGDGSPQRQVGYLLVFAITVIAVRPLQSPSRLLVLPVSLLLTFAWCWLSLTWSIAPEIATRRLVLTTILAWTIFLMTDQLGYRSTMGAMRVSMIVVLIVNYAAVLVWPTFGIHQAGEVGDAAIIGNWRGVMIQKNFAGAICAFTILAFVFDCRQSALWLRGMVIAATVFFLIKTSSKTSMGILAAALVWGWLFLRYNPYYRSYLLPFVAIVSAGIIFFVSTNWDAIVAPYYSQDALTGRVQIWPAMFAYASNHLFLGSGYGSFWNIGLGKSPILEYASGWIATYVSQGHNGYIDLLVAIGAPGLALAVLSTLLIPLVKLFASKTVSRQQGALLLALLLFCAGHNLTESSILDRDTIVQVFLMFTLALIKQATGPQGGRASARRPAMIRRTDRPIPELPPA